MYLHVEKSGCAVIKRCTFYQNAYMFRCVLSSVLPLRSVGRSNFDKGRHNLTTLIHKTDIY